MQSPWLLSHRNGKTYKVVTTVETILDKHFYRKQFIINAL